jgi:hypothetical protein
MRGTPPVVVTAKSTSGRVLGFVLLKSSAEWTGKKHLNDENSSADERPDDWPCRRHPLLIMDIRQVYFVSVALLGSASDGVTHKTTVPATRPPAGATILFDGKETSAWKHSGGQPCQWRVADGALEVTPRSGGNIVTREKFGDFTLHLEFCVPSMPDRKGQSRGNSGVKLHGLYEIQILDSLDNPTYSAGGCGAIYQVRNPDRNVSKAPGEWQTFDITFSAPRLNAEGKVAAKPRISLVWNGISVHQDVEVDGPTNDRKPVVTLPATGPILLQDHGCPVKFRNIWILKKDSVTSIPSPTDLR